MSNSDEKQYCPRTSGQGGCNRQARRAGNKEDCPWLKFCGKSGTAESKEPNQQGKHDHENGACPFLMKIRGCCGDSGKKGETVPEECATWMCWFHYMMGRHGSNGAYGHGHGFMPPFSSDDSESSESEDEANEDGMDTEVGAEKAGGEAVNEDETETGAEDGENRSVPIEFVLSACWAYYMMGAHESGEHSFGPPPMGPWGPGFGGFDPRGPPPFGPFGHHHGGPPPFGPFGHHHSGPPAFGPFGHHHGGPPPFGHQFGGGPFGYHHGGPPAFGPFGRHGKCHRRHRRHGPPSMFPGMFGGPHHRFGRCHGRRCGRGGAKGFGPFCPKLWLSKTEKKGETEKKE